MNTMTWRDLRSRLWAAFDIMQNRGYRRLIAYLPADLDIELWRDCCVLPTWRRDCVAVLGAEYDMACVLIHRDGRLVFLPEGE